MRQWLSRIMATLIVLGIILSPSLILPEVEGMPLVHATVTPNVTWDDFDAVGAYDTNCSLREALYSAIYNFDYGGCTHTGDWDDDTDTIILAHNTYSLSLSGYDDQGKVGDLDIYSVGAPAPSFTAPSPTAPSPDIIIQGAVDGSSINGNDVDRVFEIMPGISVLMDNVMIYNGLTKYPTDDSGSAIYVAGSLKITYSVIYGNRTMAGGSGGGIANMGGVLTLEHVIIQNNWTGNSTTDVVSGMGGGIYNDGELFITDVYITENNTGNNTSTGYIGGGGGIYNIGDASLVRVTIYDNYCGNASARDGAGGGGILNNGELTIRTSTISGNRSGGGGLGGNYDGGPGGGIYSTTAGVITIIDDSTIAYNWTGRSSGTGYTYGGGIAVDSTDTTIKNTIVANNDADESPDCDSGFISTGFNLVENDEGCSISGIDDTLHVDPMLAPLADLGVEGWIHALLPGSPAIDAGPAACGATDQRHQQRAIDGDRDGTRMCDIGAYEARLLEFLPLIRIP